MAASSSCPILCTLARQQQWIHVFQSSSLMGTRTPNPAEVGQSAAQCCEVPLTSRQSARSLCTACNNTLHHRVINSHQLATTITAITDRRMTEDGWRQSRAKPESTMILHWQIYPSWLIEKGLMSHQTHYRSYRVHVFLEVKWPNQQCQSTERR